VGTDPDLLAEAFAADAADCCVLPPKEDGSKQPDAPSWTRYQRARSTAADIDRWYGPRRRTGLGVVCGAVSGHLELFEFDDADVHRRYLAAAQSSGLGPLVARVAKGWSEATPGGGVHWYYRLAAGGAKTVALARRPGEDANGKPRPDPLIETKGEGGYAVVAPSHGRVHPSGRPYRRLAGGPAAVTTLSSAERDALWSLARTFDELPKAEAGSGTKPPRGEDARWEVRPGDDFNARATWDDILEPHGWEPVRQSGEETLWQRPDGHPGGWGASTNHAGSDRLYVWTTATLFDPDRSYSKFAAYAVLDHGGDFAAAARALEAKGYGTRRPPPDAGSAAPERILAPVPPFPVVALPPVARKFVLAGAEALGCPPDFVVPHLFAFCGAVAGNSRKLQIKRGFVVAPIYWVGVVGKPGTVKTPALNHARSPIDRLQEEAWVRYKRALEEWDEEKPAERGPKPRPEHFFATDTTTEAVAFALMTSRGLAIVHDEIAGWVMAFDAYKKGGDRQAWLSSWSGAPLKPNRKTGEPIYVPDPVVCVAGGIQPDVLPLLAGEAARDDGFVPRLVLNWPDAEPSPWTDAVVGEEVVAAMLGVVRVLRLPGEQTVVTTLTPGAYAEWKAWFNENQKIVAASRGLAAGWAAKAPVHLARFALGLHLLAHPSDHGRQLDADTLRDGIAVVEYYRAHLLRVLPAFGAVALGMGAGLAARVLRVLTRAYPEWVGRAEIAIRLGGHDPSEAVSVALAALEALGQATRRTADSGGRPREEWRWVGAKDPNGPDADSDHDRETGVDPPEAEDLSRNHVTTHDPESRQEASDSTPAAGWERWEEPL
jgi:hypothetical protein